MPQALRKRTLGLMLNDDRSKAHSNVFRVVVIEEVRKVEARPSVPFAGLRALGHWVVRFDRGVRARPLDPGPASDPSFVERDERLAVDLLVNDGVGLLVVGLLAVRASSWVEDRVHVWVEEAAHRAVVLARLLVLGEPRMPLWLEVECLQELLLVHVLRQV